jgi:hypothetical protein
MVTTSDGAATAPTDADGVDAPEPTAPLFQPVSARGPALIVLGIAVGILTIGIVASALISGNSPVLGIRQVTLPDGSTVALTPATSALHGIVGDGEPPADILGNLAVPTGSRLSGTINSDQGVSQFDRTVSFSSLLGATQVVGVYRTLLPRLGWQVLYSGPAPQKGAGSSEVLAKHGSGDGYYWEVGVVVSPTTSAGVTPFSMELYEVPDDN